MYGEYLCGLLEWTGSIFAYDANASDGSREAEEAATAESRFRLCQCMAKVERGGFAYSFQWRKLVGEFAYHFQWRKA